MTSDFTTDDDGHLPSGFSIIHANRMEDLRQLVIQWVRRHSLRPLEIEQYLVQSNGMAQWLKLAFAGDDGCGISAAVSFDLPARFLWRCYRAVLGAESVPEQSPFDKDRLTWRLFRMLPELSADPGFSMLARYLEDDGDQRKRFQLAARLADLYDQYQVYRGDWLKDWLNGNNRLRTATNEDLPLTPSQLWQARLWRRLCADLPPQLRETSRYALHRRFLKMARQMNRRPAGLPRRVIVFGMSSMPQQALAALHAISHICQVLLLVHNPCRHHWADIIEDRELLRYEQLRHPQKALHSQLSPSALHQHVHPLLAAWGKQGRDFIGLLYGYDRPGQYRNRFAEIDLFSDFEIPGQPRQLLPQVQQRVLDLQPLPADPNEKPVVGSDDVSIQFHTAYSRQRELEILQDRLLSFFEAQPDLKPRDIIVMIPEIDRYAPFIEAVFGNHPDDDPRHIPFTIADHPRRSGAVLLAALEKLLQLPHLRWGASDLLELLEVPAFRQRFGLSAADLPLLRQWIHEAGIRWGLDAKQRRQFDLPDSMEQNSWLFGLRRMLLGYAVGSGNAWRGIEPYDEIGGLQAALVGPLAAILERLGHHWQALGSPTSPDRWRKRIEALAGDFFLPEDSAERLFLARLIEWLEKWERGCHEAKLQAPVTLPVVRQALLSELHAGNISQRFLAGKVNFCTLMPMRAIPFKIVCLLGLNDGAFPRSHPPADFDLMSLPGHYRPGDRSRREDDRYLFLEALLSARKCLYISYLGRNVHDDSQRMPSVLVSQLSDYLEAGWRASSDPSGSGRPQATLLAQLTCHHPLQPFSRTYFQENGEPAMFTYAHRWRKVLEHADRQPDPLPLDAAMDQALQFEGLQRFLKSPVRSFYNQRLQVYFDDLDDSIEDLEPFALDLLTPFRVQPALLDAGLKVDATQAHKAVEQAVARLRGSGQLPLGGLGDLAAEHLKATSLAMIAAVHRLRRQWPHLADAVKIDLSQHVNVCKYLDLHMWMEDLHGAAAPQDAADHLPAVARWDFYPHTVLDAKGRMSRYASLLGLWCRHLGGCAQGLALTSYLIAVDATVPLLPVLPATALKFLTAMIETWQAHLCQPLTVTAKSAFAYLSVQMDSADSDSVDLESTAYTAACKAYQGDGYRSQGELGHSPYLQRSFPDFASIWQADGRRFRRLAETLYLPVITATGEALAHEPDA